MTTLDWAVLVIYLLALLILAWWLGRGQHSERDYYLAGGKLPAPALATSILATQCSTNSLLGAPAFVGFAAGGGLLWLQYELAVPLAMLLLALLFPVLYRHRPISIYAFLEERLGSDARRLASTCFLLFRGVATGVTVYGVASVLALIMEIPYLPAVALLMGVTIAYDVMGGIRAVVISDVVQMALLVAAVLVALLHLGPLLAEHWSSLEPRAAPLLDDWGLDGQSDFGFWPMLFGGLFLYAAYYGCDQSQAQRLLSAHDEGALQRILVMNGLLRFPLVLAYCLLGLGLAAYAAEDPAFLTLLPPAAGGEPNLNLVFPVYVLENFAPGIAGLAIVGLFAAAMSSIDSALNSLSASTLEDVVEAAGRHHGERQRFLMSKITTLLWGLFAVAFSFFVEHIAGTILEAINKIGSLVNGPLLGLFLIAIVAPGVGQRRALLGFGAGFGANLALWRLAPQVSWLWWNVAGCLACVAVAGILALQSGAVRAALPQPPPLTVTITLGSAAGAILMLLVALHAAVSGVGP